jgi:ribonuclease P protein component
VEIGDLLRHASRRQCSGLSVVYRENQQTHDRMGVIVSRALGGAVVRNRIKRLGREMFRRSKASQAPFLDILFLPRRGFERASASAGQEYQTWREHYAR